MSYREKRTGKQLGIDAFANIPTRTIVAKLCGISSEDMREIDQEFGENPKSQIWNQIALTKAKRYPTSQSWKQGVPTFLCGGGVRIEAYQEMVQELNSPQCSLSIVRATLPMPDNIRAPGLDSESFHRLLVAYGLSFEPFDLGKIIETSKIPDIDTQSNKATWRDNFPDRDIVE